MKNLLIIDAFISDQDQENKLSSFIDRIKKNGDDIFLISNTVIDKEIQKKVNLFLYDKKNLLFEHEYSEYQYFILWKIVGNFRLHTYHKHKQKHGLSVLVNLFNSIEIAKSLGYTHFHRIEYDMEIGDQTISFISSIPEKCRSHKKSYFYVSEVNKTQIFQYFFSEIDFFIDNFFRIKSEDDYINYLKSEFGDDKFWTVEDLMYHQIKKIPEDDIFVIDDIFSELKDSIWNTSTSKAHLEYYQQDYNTEIYKIEDKEIVDTNRILIFTKRQSSNQISRYIKIVYPDNREEIINHSLDNEGDWILNILEEFPAEIEIFNNNQSVFRQELSQLRNYAIQIA